MPANQIILSGTGETRTISLTPWANHSGGPVTIALTASNGQASATTTFQVRVTPIVIPPTITSISNQSVNENGTLGPVAFTVGDVHFPVNTLKITATSSNPALIPSSNIVFGGSGANRTLTITPTANMSGGPVTITLKAADTQSSVTTSFNVNVNFVNQPPTITAIANQTTNENTPLGPLRFTVGDLESPPNALTVTATSNNQTLLPNSQLVVSGTGANRTLLITPGTNHFGGPATVTLAVSDGDKTTTTTFQVSVNFVNQAPTITSIVNQSVQENTTLGPLAFSVGDVETNPNALTVTAVSSNQSLIADADIVVGGAGANRTLTISPQPNQYGGPVTITVTVSDGTNQTPMTFQVNVDALQATVTGVDQDYNLTSYGPLVIDAPGVLTGASSSAGYALTAALVTSPSNGTVTVNADGSFTYLAAATFVTTDTFVVQISDGHGNTTTATETVHYQIATSAAGIFSPGAALSSVTAASASSSAAVSSSSSASTTPASAASTTTTATTSATTTSTTSNPTQAGSTQSAADNSGTSTTSQDQTQNGAGAALAVHLSNPALNTAASTAAGQAGNHTGSLPLGSAAWADSGPPQSPPGHIDLHSRAGVQGQGGVIRDGLRLLERPDARASDATRFGYNFHWTPAEEAVLSQSAPLWQALRQQDQQRQAEHQFEKMLVGSATAVSSSLTAGYVLWMLRSGYVVTSVVSQMPAWSLINPVSLLEDAEDAESLTSLLERDPPVT